jgi:DNA-binding NarL/FixJ family response regulator
MSEPIRVVIADDQALLRGSFRLLVDNHAGLVTVGEAANGVEAVEVVRRERPDVVLMDIRMPEMDGVEATRRICGAPQTADVKVLILTMFNVDSYVYGALRAGASGFLLKDTPPIDLLDGIATVAGGDGLLAPSVTKRLIAEFARLPEPVSAPVWGLDGITAREREVLELVARGLSNAEIADRLTLSAGTVKSHIAHLLTKLSARDRVQLVIIAYETGLVTPQGR